MTALDDHRRATDPVERLDAARRVRQAADELEALAVEAARQSGATWRAIGECYGLTKQGAQQRFRPTARDAQPTGRHKRQNS